MSKKVKESWWVVDKSDNLQTECENKKKAQREATSRRREIRHDLQVRIRNLKKDIYIECRKENA